MTIQELRTQRDAVLLDRFCEKGVFLDIAGKTIGGVCRAGDMGEVLTVLHVFDAKEDALLEIRRKLGEIRRKLGEVTANL